MSTPGLSPIRGNHTPSNFDTRGDKSERMGQAIGITPVMSSTFMTPSTTTRNLREMFPWSKTPATYCPSRIKTDAVFNSIALRAEPANENHTPITKGVKVEQVNEKDAQEEEVDQPTIEEIYRYLRTFEEIPDEMLLDYSQEEREDIKVWLAEFARHIPNAGEKEEEYAILLRNIKVRLASPKLHNYFGSVIPFSLEVHNE